MTWRHTDIWSMTGTKKAELITTIVLVIWWFMTQAGGLIWTSSCFILLFLLQLVVRPDVVEMHDVTARDPKLLVHLKATRNTVPVPRHWCFKRKYLQGKRGIEKPPFELPDFIKATGIMEMRQALQEKVKLPWFLKHLCLCTVGSYVSLCVCLSVRLSVCDLTKMVKLQTRK